AARGVITRSAGCADRIGKRIAAVGRPEDRAADAKDAGDVLRREPPPPVGLDQSVETVLEADDLAVAIDGGLHDCADDGVQSRRIAASGQHTDALDPGAVFGRRHEVRVYQPCYTWDSCRARLLCGATPARTSSEWAASSVGRAPRSQRGGREFEPPAVHQSSLAFQASFGSASQRAIKSARRLPRRSRAAAKAGHFSPLQLPLPLSVVRSLVDSLWTS